MKAKQQKVSAFTPARRSRVGAFAIAVFGLCLLFLATGSAKAQSVAPNIAQGKTLIDPCSLVPPVFPAGAPDTFLTFLELNVPFADQTAAENYAAAYYKAVDPYDKRTTFPDWLVKNGFIKNTSEIQHGVNGDALVKRDAFAMYINDVDLGVTRRFYSLTDANGNVAIYTENYKCLSDAKLRQNLVATVAMEFRAADDGSNPAKKFITFYAYDGNDNRMLTINLDGRGEKAIPENCQICHGGNPKQLDANGNFPNHGNIGAYMLPWDIKAFVFDTVDPSLSRTAQESNIKKLNQAAYLTYKKTLKFDEVAGYYRPNALVELVQGWYGGPTLPNPTFNDAFTPKGWLPPYAPPDAASFYHDVIVTSCRSCHISRESSLDFTSYKAFLVFRDATNDLVYNSVSNPETVSGSGDDGGVMPLALKTFNNFWNSSAHDILRQFLDTH